MNVSADFWNGECNSLLSISCCAQQSPGAGTGVTAVTVASFMYLENAEIVLNGVGLLQVPWSR